MIDQNTLISYMQAAVDIVGSSPHPSNKIAATLVLADGRVISRTNAWPAAIARTLGTDVRIGNSSGTIHAETACILASSGATQDASLFVTDPPCPNCVKNMAEAGITALYIDHKGFDKDFSQRRGGDFRAMSLKVAEKAGISVYIIYRKDQRIETLQERAEGYKPLNEYPLRIEATDGVNIGAAITAEHAHYGDAPFALAFAQDADGKSVFISARAHPTLGYSHENVESPDGKYTFILEPVNRLIMGAAKRGLKLDPVHFYSSRVPTSRELINMIGSNLDKIQIGNVNDSRDEYGPAALETLENSGILSVFGSK